MLCRSDLSYARTCEHPVLSLDEALLVEYPDALVDEREHGHVHQHALDEKRVLELLTEPGKKQDVGHIYPFHITKL